LSKSLSNAGRARCRPVRVRPIGSFPVRKSRAKTVRSDKGKEERCTFLLIQVT